MSQLLDLGTTHHHAYAVFGDTTTSRQALFDCLKKTWKIRTEGNPDFFHQVFQNLSVDEARAIKDRQGNKAMGEGRKIFVIEADSIGIPAQNSLLKILEEPTPNTHFFFIGNCTRNFIPTLSSRVQKVTLDQEMHSPSKEVQAFLKASKANRLTFVKKLANDIKDEKRTKAEALALLEGIEKTLYARAEKNLPEALFRDLEMCRDYMSDPSASIKMLLEYVALIIPEGQ